MLVCEKGGVVKSRISVLITQTTLLAILALPVPLAAQKTASGTNGQIAFTRPSFTGPANVFNANPDGSDEHQVPLVYAAEDFAVPVWSPDGSKLLMSHTFRLDASGNCCLPFRPAILKPDGSDFTLLEIPDGPFDMDCTSWINQTRLLCGVGGDQPGIVSVRASDGGDPFRLEQPTPMAG